MANSKDIEFKSINTTVSEPREVLVRVNEDAQINFGNRALNTIINAIYLESEAQGTLINRDIFDIIIRLANYLNQDGERTPMRWNRNQIEKIKELVLLRMKHCEDERERGSEAFNPDSYIEMKYLLLDIQLWLSASIIMYK